MKVMRVEDAPAVTTPNAVMRTYASPATNGAAVAVWRTEMAGGAQGPRHVVSEDQVLVVLEGEASVDLDGQTMVLGSGDSVLLPRGVERVVASRGRPLTMLTCGVPAASATVDGGEPVAIPWTR